MGFTNGTGPDSCDTNPSTCMVGYDPGLLIPYVSMAVFGTSPYVKTTVTQGQCGDMRSNAVFCGYSCTFNAGGDQDLPSVVYNKFQIWQSCGEWSCPIGFDATKATTHVTVPGWFDWYATSVNINKGSCIYPPGYH